MYHVEVGLGAKRVMLSGMSTGRLGVFAHVAGVDVNLLDEDSATVREILFPR